MAILCCAKCGWVGHHYSVADLAPGAIRALQPGEPVPHGACPDCAAVLPFGVTPELDGVKRSSFRWHDDRAELAIAPQIQRDALLVALANLTPGHPGFRGSSEVEELLGPGHRLGLYVGSWVRPNLVAALYGQAFPGQADSLEGEAGRIRSALEIWRKSGKPAESRASLAEPIEPGGCAPTVHAAQAPPQHVRDLVEHFVAKFRPLHYCIGNPSAWDSYSENVSEQLRTFWEALRACAAAQGVKVED